MADGQPVNRIFAWDGTTCSSLGAGVSGVSVLSLALQGGDLIVGGGFTMAGGDTARYVARWDGTTWHPLGQGLRGGSSLYGVYDLLVRGDQIFATGRFTASGGQAMSGIAMWDGSTWRGFANGVGTWPKALEILNGDLYVGGELTWAGNRNVSNLARWRQSGLPVTIPCFVAERRGSAAHVVWVIGVGGGDVQMHLWRASDGQPRRRLTAEPRLGEGSFEFDDTSAPAGEAEYWLEIRGSNNTEMWHGPARLAAASLPGQLGLAQNQPNPFNPRTTFVVTVPARGRATLTIFDARGRVVAEPLAGDLEAGEHRIQWDGRDRAGRDVATGVYLARLTAASGVRSVRLTLIR
jgi:hypothetical protein